MTGIFRKNSADTLRAVGHAKKIPPRRRKRGESQQEPGSNHLRLSHQYVPDITMGTMILPIYEVKREWTVIFFGVFPLRF